MNGYEAYCEYVSLKKHFSDWKYDYTRYGPAKIKPETFEKRPDAFKFRKLAQRHSARWTIISTLAANESAWVGDMIGEEAETRTNRSLGRVESMTETIRRELAGLGPDCVLSVDGRHPKLAREVLGGRVSLETGAVVVGLSGCVTDWRRNHEGDVAMDSLARRLARLYPLMELNLPSVKKAVYNTLLSL